MGLIAAFDARLPLDFWKILGIVVLIAIGLPLALLMRCLWCYRRWLRDLKGPSTDSFLAGNWSEFSRHDLVFVILRWIETYGETFRLWAFLGKPRLLVTDPVALDHIFVKRAYDYPKHPSAIRLLGQLMGPGLIVAEGEQHKRQKLTLQKGFTPGSVKIYYDIFTSHAARLRDRLLESVDTVSEQGFAEQRETVAGTSGQKGVVLDVLRPVSRASLDILGQAGFGHDFGALAQRGTFGMLKSKVAPSSVRSRNSKKREDIDVLVSSHPLSRAFDVILDLALETQASVSYLFTEVLLNFFPSLEVFGVGGLSPRMVKARAVLDQEARLILDRAQQHEKLLQTERATHRNDSDQLFSTTEDAHTDSAHRLRQRDDILSTLMRANANAKATSPQSSSMPKSVLDKAILSDEELMGQMTTLMFAGHETTSVQTTWILYALAHNPRVQDKLRSEIRALRASKGLQTQTRTQPGTDTSVVEEKGEEEEQDDDDSARELTYEELLSLKYLDNVVNEGLRRYSAIHTTSRIASKHDVIPIDPARSPSAPKHGVRIEPGTLIIVPIEAIGRLKSLWGDDADDFRPERWDDDEVGSMEGKRLYTRAGGPAFLLGPRGCIGNRFGESRMEQMLLLVVRMTDQIREGPPSTPK